MKGGESIRQGTDILEGQREHVYEHPYHLLSGQLMTFSNRDEDFLQRAKL